MIILEINGQGTPILLVEQNAPMALDAASRGYVLETGQVALADDAKALRENEQVRKTYLGETSPLKKFWRTSSAGVAEATASRSQRWSPPAAPPPGRSAPSWPSPRARSPGSVSGGCVEHEVYEEAKDVLANGTTKLVTYGIRTSRPGTPDFPAAGDRRPPYAARRRHPHAVEGRLRD